MKTFMLLLSMVVITLTLNACRKPDTQDVSEMLGSAKSMDGGSRDLKDKMMQDNPVVDAKRSEILVQFKADVPKETAERVALDYRLKIIKPLSAPNLYLFETPGDGPVEEVIERLNRLADIEYAEPNFSRNVR